MPMRPATEFDGPGPSLDLFNPTDHALVRWCLTLGAELLRGLGRLDLADRLRAVADDQ